jgi:predicted DNA-binding transcriptional regulator AlpA
MEINLNKKEEVSAFLSKNFLEIWQVADLTGILKTSIHTYLGRPTSDFPRPVWESAPTDASGSQKRHPTRLWLRAEVLEWQNRRKDAHHSPMKEEEEKMIAEGNEPRFDIDFIRSKEGVKAHNLFLETTQNPDLEGKHEVKTDYISQKTGNLYIEYAQRGLDGVWRPSGLSVTTSEYWVQMSPTDKAGFWVDHQLLKDFIKANDFRVAEQPICTEDTNASVGILVPFIALLQHLEMLP